MRHHWKNSHLKFQKVVGTFHLLDLLNVNRLMLTINTCMWVVLTKIQSTWIRTLYFWLYNVHDSGLYEKKYFVCVQFTANAVSNFPINGQCSKRIVCKDGYQHIFKTTHISIPSNFPLFIHGICIFELLATVNKAGFCQPH